MLTPAAARLHKNYCVYCGINRFFLQTFPAARLIDALVHHSDNGRLLTHLLRAAIDVGLGSKTLVPAAARRHKG